MLLDVELEEWSGSPVVRVRGRDYERKAASAFADAAAGISPRQGVFYRNLIRIAVARKSAEIPVDFEIRDGRPVYLDRGCIKIAELAGFIEPLANAASGKVEIIRLA